MSGTSGAKSHSRVYSCQASACEALRRGCAVADTHRDAAWHGDGLDAASCGLHHVLRPLLSLLLLLLLLLARSGLRGIPFPVTVTVTVTIIVPIAVVTISVAIAVAVTVVIVVIVLAVLVVLVVLIPIRSPTVGAALRRNSPGALGRRLDAFR